MTLSELPSNWVSVPISELLKNKWLVDHMDGNHGSDYPRSEEFVESGVPYIAANSIQSGKVNFRLAKYLSAERAAQLRKGFAQDGDVLFAHNATVGPVALLKTSHPQVILGTSLTYYRCNPNHIEPLYLKYYLESHWFVSQYQPMMGQSTRNQVPITAQREFTCVLPPLPEQQKIAAILSTWDRAIELTEKLIAAKQKRKQALMQQILTGKVRFAEFVKSKQMQRTPIGYMPTDWKKHRLGKVVEKVKRKNPDGEGHVLTASGEHGLVDQREFFNRSVAGADLSGYYLLKRGEFAYNRSAMKGYPFGAIKRLNRYEQGVLSTLYICFGISDECCDSNFLCHFFEARLLDQQLRGVTQVGGRAHGLLNITDGDFYSMSVVLPSIEEQRKIAAVLDAQDLEIGQLRNMLDALTQQKRGLMQQLLTGKVRVDTR